MNVCVFCVVHWNNEDEFKKLNLHMLDWKKRICQSLHNPFCFTAAGSYSNPKYKLNQLQTIQIGIPINKIDFFSPTDYIDNWKCGFLTGIYHALSHLEWDVLIYAHYAVLLDLDLNSIINDFMKSDKILCAPQQITQRGNSIETGFMIMKPDAAKKFATHFCGRETITDSTNSRIATEHQALLLFSSDWYKMIPTVATIKKKLPEFVNKKLSQLDKQFEITDKNFLKLPMIFGTEKHCGKKLLNQWIRKHPLK